MYHPGVLPAMRPKGPPPPAPPSADLLTLPPPLFPASSLGGGKTVELDTELISILMLFEMSMVMGFVSPIVPLLCLCAILTHLGVFWVSRVHLGAVLSHEAKPVSNILCSHLSWAMHS